MFQKECKEFTAGAMLSVTAVRVSPDMSYARVYLSIFPSNLTEKVLESLAEKNKSIRFILGKKIGKQTRIIPELKFFVDDSLDYIDQNRFPVETIARIHDESVDIHCTEIPVFKKETECHKHHFHH